MIRFFYRAGSSGTARQIHDSIRQNLDEGHKVILLVPEQETVSVERRMLKELPAPYQLTFEVLNFSRLANRIFRQSGGLSHHAASPAVSALFMWQAINKRSGDLVQYGSAAAKDAALCDMMLATAAQCGAACLSPKDLLDTSDKLPEGDPLRDKLTDIGLVLSTYEQLLGEKFENASDDLNRLAVKLSKEGKALLADTYIYIDSFTDFTAQELAVIETLIAAAPEVSFTFPLEDQSVKSGLHLLSVLHTHEKLERMAKRLGKQVFRIPVAESSAEEEPVLRFLSRHLFDMGVKDGSVAGSPVHLCECASPFEEAAAIAMQIHRLIRGGCQYRDIAVVVRDATSWNGILDDVFEREGIPCFISEKTDITLRPLIKLILQALRIKLRGWHPDDVVGYLKTDLCGISSDDVNLFEEYVNVWHPKGEKAYTSGPFTKNPDGYKERLSDRGARILESANRVREALIPPLQRLFSDLDNATCVTELCTALYEFLNVLDIREKLKLQAEDRIRAGERREAEELSRLYNVTVDALEALSLALGDEYMDPAHFADALRIVFGRTDIGTIPTAADEVTIGSASMLRADHPKYVLIAGLNEGVFPATVKDDGLLSEAERRQMQKYHKDKISVEFISDSKQRMSDELFYLYRAFSAPRKELFLYYAQRGTDGRALSPSIAVSRIKALFPSLPTERYDAIPPLERIYTHNGAIEAYTELPEAQKSVLPAELLKSVGNGINTVERRAAISPKRAQRIFQNGRFSPTAFENYSSCQFKYYCSSILNLREEAKGSMSSADTGNFIHHVLEQVMKAVKEDRSQFSDMSAAKQAELVEDICAAYRRELTEAGGELTPRTEALFRRLGDLAKLIVSGLFAEFADSLFSPAFLELSLSEIGEKSTVTLSDGETIALTGRIDRVDYWQDEGGNVYLRVIDYKTGSKSFKLEDIEKGFCLQMPLYLLALCRGRHEALCERLDLKDKSTVFLPAAVTYLSSNISVEKTDSRKDRNEAMADAVSRLEREGVLLDNASVRYALSKSGDPAILGSPRTKSKTPLSEGGFDEMFGKLEGSISRITACMRSGSANAEPQAHGKSEPCDYCPYIAVCRAAKKGKE